MKNSIFFLAETRGHVDHGWLNAYHSFSFATYYNPDREQFGALRVLNDDTVSGGMGFGMHPHKNMEIITIPLKGALEHKDSMGNHGVIQHGDVQVMSAGTGIFHSEFNPDPEQEVKLFQIWVFPDKNDVTPRYDQLTLNLDDRHNKLQQIVSPNPDDVGVWIHQQSWFHLGKFDNGVQQDYSIKLKGNGVYVFVIEGSFEVDGQTLNKRDAVGVWNTDKLTLKSKADASEILLIEVPMLH